MKADTEKRLLELAKKALTMVSIRDGGTNFVFELRDLIRQAEKEVKEENAPDEVH